MNFKIICLCIFRRQFSGGLESKGTMRIGLRSEFHRFSQNGILLKRLYSDTLKALDDIYSSGVIPKGATLYLFFLIEEVIN